MSSIIAVACVSATKAWVRWSLSMAAECCELYLQNLWCSLWTWLLAFRSSMLLFHDRTRVRSIDLGNLGSGRQSCKEVEAFFEAVWLTSLIQFSYFANRYATSRLQMPCVSSLFVSGVSSRLIITDDLMPRPLFWWSWPCVDMVWEDSYWISSLSACISPSDRQRSATCFVFVAWCRLQQLDSKVIL